MLLPDMSGFSLLQLALKRKHRFRSLLHLSPLFGWGEKSDFQKLFCYWPEDKANSQYSEQQSVHIQEFYNKQKINTSNFFVQVKSRRLHSLSFEPSI